MGARRFAGQGPVVADNPEDVAARKANWNKALELVGDSVVLATKDGPVQTLARKGYDPLEVPETVVRAAEEYGCATPSKILSGDELDGRESFDPTPDAVAALDWVWERVDRAGMCDGKAKPPLHCFRKVMDGGTVVLGFVRDGVVYVNEDLATGTSIELRQTILEEVAHYLTKSADCTRDLQDWAFKLAVRIAMTKPVAYRPTYSPCLGIDSEALGDTSNGAGSGKPQTPHTHALAEVWVDEFFGDYLTGR